ncbi:hypothetical protein [Haloarcula salinisoli]|uniref:hypothetical protein n=1 Tax=Haloarcula salinisoli TaxID=2487746 RepID=UPI001C731BBF|nr:hypothetical protein [Halomicroarcula salinisoli]
MTTDNRQLQQTRDAFDNVYFNRTNAFDIASHYPNTPVRWRICVDGNRVVPEYDSVSWYNHADDFREITQNAGETVVFETLEQPRYVSNTN